MFRPSANALQYLLYEAGIRQSGGTFGEDLVGVLGRFERHCCKDIHDKLIRNVFMEKVTHRIDKYPLWLFPVDWQFQAIRPQPQVKPLLVGVPLDTPEAFGK